MKKTWDDICRVMTEESASFGDKTPEEVIEEWFARHGFAEGTKEELQEHLMGGFNIIMQTLVKKYIEETEEPEGPMGMRALPPEVFMSAVASMGMGGFTLGFIVRDQLGGGETRKFEFEL